MISMLIWERMKVIKIILIYSYHTKLITRKNFKNQACGTKKAVKSLDPLLLTFLLTNFDAMVLGFTEFAIMP